VLQFDGQGNVTANWTQASGTATANVSATGTYTVNSACLGSVTLTDTAGNKYAGRYPFLERRRQTSNWWQPTAVDLHRSRARCICQSRTGSGERCQFPSRRSPCGERLFDLRIESGNQEDQPTSVPLPTTLLTTTVTVNGEPAPLFYVDPGQINAQMPEDIKPGVATVVVKNGSSTSNAAAVIIPATGTPGIVVYGNNRAGGGESG